MKKSEMLWLHGKNTPCYRKATMFAMSSYKDRHPDAKVFRSFQRAVRYARNTKNAKKCAPRSKRVKDIILKFSCEDPESMIKQNKRTFENFYIELVGDGINLF